jgi:hypothetical protein
VIDVKDVKLAVGMYDSKITDTAVLGGERLRSVVAREINARPLLLSGQSRGVPAAAVAGGVPADAAPGTPGSLHCSIPKHAVRMVPEINSSLLKRSFSYIPGGEAYDLPSQQAGAGGPSDAAPASASSGSAASSGGGGSGGATTLSSRAHLPPAPRIHMSLSSGGAGAAAGSNSMGMATAKR